MDLSWFQGELRDWVRSMFTRSLRFFIALYTDCSLLVSTAVSPLSLGHRLPPLSSVHSLHSLMMLALQPEKALSVSNLFSMVELIHMNLTPVNRVHKPNREFFREYPRHRRIFDLLLDLLEPIC